MTYTTVLFDLDGTLVHTGPTYRYTVVGKVLSNVGKSASEKVIDRFWFNTGRDIIVQKEFGIDPILFWKMYQRYETLDLRRQHIKAYPDAKRTVQNLKKRGIKIGLVSGAPRKIVELELELIDADLFDTIIIAHTTEGVRPKPDPEGIHKALENLQTQPQRAVYIGNADEDIIAAQNAQVLDILINRDETFCRERPTRTIHTLDEVFSLI